MGLDVGDLDTDLGGGPGLGPSPSFSLMAGDSIEVNEANISQHFYNTTDWTNSYVSCIFMLSEINIKVRILFQHDLSLQSNYFQLNQWAQLCVYIIFNELAVVFIVKSCIKFCC